MNQFKDREDFFKFLNDLKDDDDKIILYDYQVEGLYKNACKKGYIEQTALKRARLLKNEWAERSGRHMTQIEEDALVSELIDSYEQAIKELKGE